tara:strand:+ start:185 stop:565 length:381 start_codon:yes stop_codon:yes gene_type:complete
MIPNIDIDINKILEVALKYKTQLTFLGMLFLLLLSFQLGKNSVEIPGLPDKDEYCSEYDKLYKVCKKQLTKCTDECDDRIDKSIDLEREACKLRVLNAIKEKEKQNNISNCRIAKSKARQCKQRGQ